MTTKDDMTTQSRPPVEPLTQEFLDSVRRDIRRNYAGTFTGRDIVDRLLDEVERLQVVEVASIGAHALLEDAQAEVERLRVELDAIRTRAQARSEELLAARDRTPYGDGARRRRFEFAASELRALATLAALASAETGDTPTAPGCTCSEFGPCPGHAAADIAQGAADV